MLSANKVLVWISGEWLKLNPNKYITIQVYLKTENDTAVGIQQTKKHQKYLFELNSRHLQDKSKTFN